MSTNGGAKVTINGQTVEAEPGRLLIDVAEEIGIFIPRFCYHPGMKSVAVCRMCLVAVEGMPKLVPACATPVAADMEVNTVDEQAVDAQKGMLEFLLINHPLDCPICDRGGECPLQDQTYAHGPGSSRYVEPKRTFEKALEISDLVVLDRERCVLCWRCVRFSDEIAGDQFIQLVDRGPGTQILTFNDEPFDSYFSGNTIQICPVGALTSKPYRFVSRPWDLVSAPSICAYCSVGCPLTNDVRGGQLVRTQALPNENVNDFWTCDKGRFGYHYVSSEDRLTTPLIRNQRQEFEPVSWGEAVGAATGPLSRGRRVGVIAGGHLTTEDAYGVARLAKRTIGTPHVDSRLQDAGAPYELALEVGDAAGSTATINDLESARTIVWVGPDPKETLPVLYLRLRQAWGDHNTKLIVISARRISLDGFATHVVRCDPGGEALALQGLMDGSELPAASDVGDPTVVCWGPSSPGRDETGIFHAVIELVKAKDAKLLMCPPHAGSQGLIDMGVHPTLDAGYNPAPTPGLDTRGILQAATEGELETLLLVGADPIADFPDSELATQALAGGVFVVAVEILPTESVAYADVVLPSAAYAEREGTFTNLERRLQKLQPVLPPPGSAIEPWKICARLAAAMGDNWGLPDFDDVWRAINADVPSHSGLRADHLRNQPVTPAPYYESGFEGETSSGTIVAGPGGQYPHGHRAGSPFQTGQNWPLSWELRAFEAKQRPGLIPSVPAHNGNGSPHVRGTSPPSAAARAPGRFALYSGRLIYDEGTMVSRTTALREIQKKPFVEMHPDDVRELELSDGDSVVVESDGGAAELRIIVSDIAKGAVFVPYDQEGLRANRLIRGASPTVALRKP